jgi:hypothetical protein
LFLVVLDFFFAIADPPCVRKWSDIVIGHFKNDPFASIACGRGEQGGD